MKKLHACQEYLSPICRDLRMYRNIRGLSQKSLSMAIGVNQSQYSKKELGKQEFTLSEIFEICKILDLEWKIEFCPKNSGLHPSILNRTAEHTGNLPFFG
jgi:transcriptional regulator with XRE-family HTH domain